MLFICFMRRVSLRWISRCALLAQAEEMFLRLNSKHTLLHFSLEVIFPSAVSLIESTESLKSDARRVEMLIHGRIIEHIHHN